MYGDALGSMYLRGTTLRWNCRDGYLPGTDQGHGWPAPATCLPLSQAFFFFFFLLGAGGWGTRVWPVEATDINTHGEKKKKKFFYPFFFFPFIFFILP
ncbi:hypothetical protein CPSG_08672 [Coccidioides posadasii str. Silveira]|uniref:Uncharacterized protein n=1 Tax=Coccidioides posadasii (strain RMSCC 757 / Silveira) TaxID=443226 RepID=E9DFS3_COCPS|nr:hypothetical protein CPSG_08672 [Coccidioides posadasii str. Silveira]